MKQHIIRISAWAALLSLAQAVFAECGPSTSAPQASTGIPNGYYKNADGKSAKALKVALGEIARNHTVLSYSKLWEYYEYTDVVPGTQNQVFDYYSPEVYYFTGNGSAPAGANKEHACPQSWWGGGNGSNCYSDLFNVMPSESGANSAKSNYPLGTTSNASYSNGRMKVGNSNRAAYSGKVFEPCDEFKGDFARIYFYVATCYANAAWGSKSSVASTCAFKQEDYPTIKSWVLDLLLQWNAQDPVSEWEIERQERVYSKQKNRNPFIDYPQLADYIWGDSTAYTFDLETAVLHGGASGGGYNPGDDPGTDPDDPGTNPDDPGTNPDQPGGSFEVGEELMNDTFSDITEGNDNESGGSSKAWDGNDNFPTPTNCYKAGGSVRMGSSKGIGTMTSRPLGNASGTNLVVELSVKGWTSVEGDLLVSASGSEEQALTYTATMNDNYQTLVCELKNCSSNAVLTLKTSAKRIFISSVKVNIGESSEAITAVLDDAKEAPVCNLLGQRIDPREAQGLCVRNGKVVLLR